MSKGNGTFLVAAAQVAPAFLDRRATLEKACETIAEAGRRGARLVVFPEAFFPAYPDWIWLLPAGESGELDDLYATLLENAVAVPADTTARLCQAARKAKIQVVMGVNERNQDMP